MSSGEWPRALPPFALLRGGAISLGKLPLEVCCTLLESGLERVCLFPSHLWGGGGPQPLTLESRPPEVPSSAAAGTGTYSPARVHSAHLGSQRTLSEGRNNKG